MIVVLLDRRINGTTFTLAVVDLIIDTITVDLVVACSYSELLD
jgi:hypothetical protein